MQKIGLTSVTFRSLDAEKIVEIAKSNGLDGIEWGSDIHVPVGDTENAEKIGKMTKDAGLEVFSYGSYFKLGSDMDFGCVSSTALSLGASEIRIWAGSKGSKATNSDELNSYVNELEQVCKIGSLNNQKISLEYHKNTYNDNSASSQLLIDLLRQKGVDNIFTYWQPLGSFEENLPELSSFNDQITNIHVFHWKSNGVRKSLKKGRKDWAAYLTAIEKLKGEHKLIIEFVKHDLEKNFCKDVAILKELNKSI